MVKWRSILENRKDLRQSLKYILSFVFSLVVFFGVIIGVVIPGFELHNSMKQERTEHESRLDILEKFASKHKNYERYHEEQLRLVARLQQELPGTLNENVLVGRLQRAAKESKFCLNKTRLLNESYKAIGKKGNKSSQFVSVEVGGEGSYLSIRKFLDLLEKYRAMDFDNITIESNKEKMLKLNMVCRVYYAKK